MVHRNEIDAVVAVEAPPSQDLRSERRMILN
jgi:hypothetical protein